MQSIIDILAANRVHTANEEISQIQSLVYFLLRDPPVCAIRWQALQHFLWEGASVYVEFMQYHSRLSLHFTFFTEDSYELTKGERWILYPFADSQNKSLSLQCLRIHWLYNNLRHLDVEGNENSVLVYLGLGYLHVFDKHLELGFSFSGHILQG